MVTVSAHTIHGPKGIGGLYVREGTPVHKWMDGGFQELNLRPGVENIPGAVGFAKAVELVNPEENARLQSLRDRLTEEDIEETRFRTLMASFGVEGEIFERPLESFSEGQRKKVDLCRSFLAPTHLLLWDEPLNYLDLMSREQIEKVVLEYEPTLLFVEHDRYFTEQVATGVIHL